MNNNGNLNFEEVAAKYPGVPKFIIRKIDTALRGVTATDRALQRARESNALFEDVVEEHGKRVSRQTLGGAVLRDGTTVSVSTGLPSVNAFHGSSSKKDLIRVREGEPYSLDVVDDKLVVVDGDEPVEEVFLAPIPEYYGKKTSRGTPMHEVVSGSGGDCLGIDVNSYCHFWKTKQPCKYCYFPIYAKSPGWGDETEAKLEDIYETVSEALKETGRWSAIALESGSDPRGSAPYEEEVTAYIRVLKTLGRCFGSKGIPARLIAAAFPEEQLRRLAEAGARTYEPHLEVWDEKLWEWICPGKAKWFGRQYWIDSAIAAVKVFGRGNVCSQFVAGVEMAQPHGFKTIDEAVASTLEGAEFFAQHGVTTSMNVLWVGHGSIFYKQKQQSPPLEYHVRITSGLRDIRRKYRLGVDFNDYRRCQHPDTTLSRLDYPEVEI